LQRLVGELAAVDVADVAWALAKSGVKDPAVEKALTGKVKELKNEFSWKAVGLVDWWTSPRCLSCLDLQAQVLLEQVDQQRSARELAAVKVLLSAAEGEVGACARPQAEAAKPTFVATEFEGTLAASLEGAGVQGAKSWVRFAAGARKGAKWPKQEAGAFSSCE
jgi:hypothetical protein